MTDEALTTEESPVVPEETPKRAMIALAYLEDGSIVLRKPANVPVPTLLSILSEMGLALVDLTTKYAQESSSGILQATPQDLARMNKRQGIIG